MLLQSKVKFFKSDILRVYHSSCNYNNNGWLATELQQRSTERTERVLRRAIGAFVPMYLMNHVLYLSVFLRLVVNIKDIIMYMYMSSLIICSFDRVQVYLGINGIEVGDITYKDLTSKPTFIAFIL